MTDSLDMGKDSYSGLYANYVRDAFGYSIDYYKDSTQGIFDYLPAGLNQSGFKYFESPRGTSNLNDAGRNLFNGNISYLTTAIPEVESLNNGIVKASPQVRHFHYDKLNRITGQQTAQINETTKVWDDKKDRFLTQYSYDNNGNLLTLNRNDQEANIMDELNYNYEQSNSDFYSNQTINRLALVVDNVGQTGYELDFEEGSEYTYDATGNLITDSGEEIANIEWNTYGKVAKVTRVEECNKPDLEFWYDPMGNRLCKIVKPRDENGYPTTQEFWTFTWYMRDAQGNMMATYKEYHIEQNVVATLYLEEFPLYGSNRLGIQREDLALSEVYYKDDYYQDGFFVYIIDFNQLGPPDPNHYTFNPIFKQYELSNHLGNVLVTISAKPRLLYDQKDDFLYKEADVTSVSDYYPFGMLAPARHWQSDGYKFGFNGKEDLNEINGWQDYGERMYNRLIGRFPTADPLIVKGQQYAWYSPYQFAGNVPIKYIDIDGLEPGEPYNTVGDAALNFASIYGKMSIQENREYSVAYYAFRDSDGTVKYTYTIPKRGTKDSSPIVRPKEYEGPFMAGGHTHGAWKKTYTSKHADYNNEFSPEDKTVARRMGVPEILCTPAGQILGYIPSINHSFEIDNNAPSDPGAQGRVNENYATSPDKNLFGRIKEKRHNAKENRALRKEYNERYMDLIEERNKGNNKTNN